MAHLLHNLEVSERDPTRLLWYQKSCPILRTRAVLEPPENENFEKVKNVCHEPLDAVRSPCPYRRCCGIYGFKVDLVEHELPWKYVASIANSFSRFPRWNVHATVFETTKNRYSNGFIVKTNEIGLNVHWYLFKSCTTTRHTVLKQ